MNTREELEIRGIIDKNGKHINEPCPYHPEGQECAMCEGTGLIYKGTIIDREQLAQAILDKLPELVEIDLEKLKTPLIYHIKGCMSAIDLHILAHAICQAKGIIKVKEGKC